LYGPRIVKIYFGEPQIYINLKSRFFKIKTCFSQFFFSSQWNFKNSYETITDHYRLLLRRMYSWNLSSVNWLILLENANVWFLNFIDNKHVQKRNVGLTILKAVRTFFQTIVAPSNITQTVCGWFAHSKKDWFFVKMSKFIFH
jgi:hypothetical protein